MSCLLTHHQPNDSPRTTPHEISSFTAGALSRCASMARLLYCTCVLFSYAEASTVCYMLSFPSASFKGQTLQGFSL